MPAAVFDADAIRARRLDLFPPFVPTIEAGSHDGERLGTIKNHCGICPLPPADDCTLVCRVQRDAIKDGVTVT